MNELREWLQGHGVTQVAMESTGGYWKPVLNILDDAFKVILVNARHKKNVPGRQDGYAVKMFTEIGTKPGETFDNPKRLAKWTGICPGNN